MKNIKILTITFATNFLFGIVSIIGVNCAFHIAFRGLIDTLGDMVALVFLILFFVAFWKANRFCFKNSSKDSWVFALSVLMLLFGFVSPWIILVSFYEKI